MNARRISYPSLATSLLVVAGAGLGVLGAIWWARSFAPSRRVVVDAASPHDHRSPAYLSASVLFDDEPELTACPNVSSHHLASADDLEALSPEDLGSAFLARATDSLNDIDESDLDAAADMPGFQIATLAMLMTPELVDDDSEIDFPSDSTRQI